MASLSVGFSFGVIETPTKAKFEQQALSLSLSALNPDDFAAGLGIIKSSVDSASSNALETGDTTGQLWIDGRGDVWVMEASGPVKVYRFEMGWESRRYFAQESGSIGLELGAALTTRSNSQFEDFGRGQGDSDSTGPLLETDTLDLRTSGSTGHYHGVQVDSGQSEFVRWSGRGGAIFRHPQPTLGDTFTFDRSQNNNIHLITKDPILGDYAHHFFSTDFDSNVDKFMGYTTSPSTGTSVVSEATFPTNGFQYRVEQFGWNYGPYMRGFRFAGVVI